MDKTKESPSETGIAKFWQMDANSKMHGGKNLLDASHLMPLSLSLEFQEGMLTIQKKGKRNIR